MLCSNFVWPYLFLEEKICLCDTIFCNDNTQELEEYLEIAQPAIESCGELFCQLLEMCVREERTNESVHLQKSLKRLMLAGIPVISNYEWNSNCFHYVSRLHADPVEFFQDVYRTATVQCMENGKVRVQSSSFTLFRRCLIC